MVQSRGRAGFTPEPFQGLRVVREFVGKKFQGDEAPELGVFSLINHAHPTAAQLVHNTIVRDSLPDHVCPMMERGNVRREMRAKSIATRRASDCCRRTSASTERG